MQRAGARGTTDPMKRQVFVVDTNVIVSGLIGADPKSPPARILDAMLDGDLLYLMSSVLLAEYSSVLRRRRIARLHGRADDELDRLLTDLTANAVWRQPSTDPPAPESGDNHLWALLSSWPDSRLVTGDRLLVENPPATGVVVTPRQVADTFLPTRE